MLNPLTYNQWASIQDRYIDPEESKFSSEVVQITKCIYPYKDIIIDGILINKESDTDIKISKGTILKDQVCISFIEDIILSLDSSNNYYGSDTQFDSAGVYYILLQYWYGKNAYPPNIAKIVITKNYINLQSNGFMFLGCVEVVDDNGVFKISKIYDYDYTGQTNSNKQTGVHSLILSPVYQYSDLMQGAPFQNGALRKLINGPLYRYDLNTDSFKPVTNNRAITKDLTPGSLDQIYMPFKNMHINDPSGLSPSLNDLYYIGETPIGDFIGHQCEIARWTENGWKFYPNNPLDGTIVINRNDLQLYYWDDQSNDYFTKDIIERFSQLSDTPNNYLNKKFNYLSINDVDDKIEFVPNDGINTVPMLEDLPELSNNLHVIRDADLYFDNFEMNIIENNGKSKISIVNNYLANEDTYLYRRDINVPELTKIGEDVELSRYSKPSNIACCGSIGGTNLFQIYIDTDTIYVIDDDNITKGYSIRNIDFTLSNVKHGLYGGGRSHNVSGCFKVSNDSILVIFSNASYSVLTYSKPDGAYNGFPFSISKPCKMPESPLDDIEMKGTNTSWLSSSKYVKKSTYNLFDKCRGWVVEFPSSLNNYIGIYCLGIVTAYRNIFAMMVYFDDVSKQIIDYSTNVIQLYDYVYVDGGGLFPWFSSDSFTRWEGTNEFVIGFGMLDFFILKSGIFLRKFLYDFGSKVLSLGCFLKEINKSLYISGIPYYPGEYPVSLSTYIDSGVKYLRMSFHDAYSYSPYNISQGNKIRYSIWNATSNSQSAMMTNVVPNTNYLNGNIEIFTRGAYHYKMRSVYTVNQNLEIWLADVTILPDYNPYGVFLLRIEWNNEIPNFTYSILGGGYDKFELDGLDYMAASTTHLFVDNNGIAHCIVHKQHTSYFDSAKPSWRIFSD